MKKRSLVYFQSGGPTTVINSSFYGVIAESLKHNDQIEGIYGSLNGVEGLINDDLVDLRKEDLEQIELLKQTPGAALGSSRKKLPGVDDPLFDNIIKTIEKHNIGYVLVNGGNDSMDTCFRLHSFFTEKGMDIKVIGVPKTIDNDLVVTDHCLGYPSAARHVINFMKMTVIDAKSYKKGKVVLVEIMGRNAGWLTASVDLLPEGERPDLIYLPESPFVEEEFIDNVDRIYKEKGYCVVALSEGLPLKRVNCGVVDSFGHMALEGVGQGLSELITEKLGYGTRVMDLSLAQRADPILASELDRNEAIQVGKYAVRQILSGQSGKMVCIRRLVSDAYEADYFLAPVEDIANRERTFPKEWIVDEKGLSAGFKDYLKPLMDRGAHVSYEDGVFRSAHLKLEKVK